MVSPESWFTKPWLGTEKKEFAKNLDITWLFIDFFNNFLLNFIQKDDFNIIFDISRQIFETFSYKKSSNQDSSALRAGTD